MGNTYLRRPVSRGTIAKGSAPGAVKRRVKTGSGGSSEPQDAKQGLDGLMGARLDLEAEALSEPGHHRMHADGCAACTLLVQPRTLGHHGHGTFLTRLFHAPAAAASQPPGIDTRPNMSKLQVVTCSKNDNARVLAGAGGPFGFAMSGAADPLLSRHANANRPVFRASTC